MVYLSEELQVCSKEINGIEEKQKFKMELGNKEICYFGLRIKILDINLFMMLIEKNTYPGAIMANDSYQHISYKMAAI